MSRTWSWRPLALVAIVLVAVVVLFVCPVGDWLARFLAWVEDLGFWGEVLLALAFIPACLFLIPGTLLSLGAGFAFGVVEGTITVSLGSTCGAAVAFLAGRTFARGLVERKIRNHPRFLALDEAVAREGFKIVLLTRLSPVFPFTVLNYAFGLTRVRFRDYLLASWIGMLPGTVMYVYLGSLAGTLTDILSGRVESTPAQRVLFGVGLLATVVVTVLITRLARQALARTAPQVAGPPPAQEPHHDPDPSGSAPRPL